MNYFSGATADVDILSAVESWVEDYSRFESCWHCHDASFGYSYGSEDGVHKAVEWEFEAPYPFTGVIDIQFPFVSEADGETYENVEVFVASLGKYIAEINLYVPGHGYNTYTRLSPALVKSDDGTNCFIVTAEAI